ncbi:MAG: sirohydrochlorin cobaltochelatase [Desulfoprunum sp.]|nr:sirohydrochlorin cobaltochelatase [Desulfoprunum sp.]
MKTPLVLAAFGTTSQAFATYQDIEQQVRTRFAGHPVFWAYTSRGVNRQLHEQTGKPSYSPLEVLQDLANQGCRQAVIQSLHLLPGHEFHQLLTECRKSALSCHIGMPILYTPLDYQQLADCLAPSILSRPDKAILLIGHGTNHPIWVAYHALEAVFRRRFGQRIFVGVVEKNPVSETIPAEIAAAGFKQVCMIPVLLVAGMHYNRDVIGTGDNSWLLCLQRQGLEVENITHGLGRQPGLCEIIIDHIKEALFRADKHESKPRE